MNSATIRTSIAIGIAASLAIILFQFSDILLVYKYFKFDYYISAVALLFLIAGFFISKYKQPVSGDHIANAALLNLTERELSILQLITEGKSNKEIAAISYVEVSTVKTHINNIYSKLGLSSRREAIRHFKGKL